MIDVVAAVCLDIPAEVFPARIRALLEQPLRRSGDYAKLCVAGMRAALSAHDVRCPAWAEGAREVEARETAVLWSSVRGAFTETRKVLSDIAGEEEIMPFDFIATMPVMPAAQCAQLDPRVTQGTFLPAMSGSLATWPRMLALAQGWMARQCCQRVACGWVEESASPDAPFRSHWVVVAPAGQGVRGIDLAALLDIDAGWHSRDGEGARFVPALLARHPEFTGRD